MPVTFVPACVRVCLLLRCIGAACIFRRIRRRRLRSASVRRGKSRSSRGKKGRKDGFFFWKEEEIELSKDIPFSIQILFSPSIDCRWSLKKEIWPTRVTRFREKEKNFHLRTGYRMIRKLHNKYIYMGNIAILCKKGKKRKKKRTVAKVTRY